MAEQTFRSPGFFEQEIDLSARSTAPTGTPAGIIGTAIHGPAFVPVTIGSFRDFENRFGSLHPDRFGPYAVREFLKHRDAVTYVRVLGAGGNDTATHIGLTADAGVVNNAGLVLSGTKHHGQKRAHGVMQFLAAKHHISASELAGFPVFSDNNSFASPAANEKINLVRAVLLTTTGSRFHVIDGGTDLQGKESSFFNENAAVNDVADFGWDASANRTFFKLVLSSTTGADFGSDDECTGVQIFSASLNPSSDLYISKILNTNPDKFQEREHLLYADFAVEHELAPADDQATTALATDTIALLSGSGGISGKSPISDLTYQTAFGRWDTRYTTPKTPYIISQPFGAEEHDLFYFETLSDGAYANDKYKISIANVKASLDPKYPYGSFTVQVRRFYDTDKSTEIIEAYPECNLDPRSDRYVAKQIGDYKVQFDFDNEDPDERRLVIKGKYPNRSQFIRIRMNAEIEEGAIPREAIPFGFRGIPVLKTTTSLTDDPSVVLTKDGKPLGHSVQTLDAAYLDGESVADDPTCESRLRSGVDTVISGSIVPPLPFRFKATAGKLDTSPSEFIGEPGGLERADARLYWGVKTTMVPRKADDSDGIFKTNAGALPNPLVKAYTKFMGIEKLDTLVTGSAKDEFNNNKFSLAKVALYNELDSNGHISEVSGTAKSHMREAAYIRNGVLDGKNYTVRDNVGDLDRITLATLAASSSIHFNRFADYNKFTTIFYGGWDGLNFLDRDNRLMNDKASSNVNGGKASAETATAIANGGLSQNSAGTGRLNNIINSYNVAVRMMTDGMVTNANILAIPGIRDPYVTDLAADRTRDYKLAIYLMDLVKYGKNLAGTTQRLFDGDTVRADVRTTAEKFDSRGMDNNYVATYFPDVTIDDPVNSRRVEVPASIAALASLAYNDRVAYPWFAPAGFNRGALDFVSNVDVRLTSADRDTLYDARINPVGTFPNAGFVIFGQKTLQMAKTALDRVNVRRMLLEIKRLISMVAVRLLFEQNNAATRARFIGQVNPLLALVQAQAGIESFSIVMDDSNNSEEDRENNRLNGRIVVVPTRAVEFIAIDFIITNSGVLFE